MLNKITLIGNVGKQPEIRSTKNGEELASFSLATTETWKNKSGEKESRTEWHKIIVYGAIVNVVKNYVKQGSKLYIQGKIQTRSWEDKEGNKRNATEVVLQGFGSKLILLDPKQDKTQIDKDFEVIEQDF